MIFLFLENWWGPLEHTEKIFWSIALISSILLLIQIILGLLQRTVSVNDLQGTLESESHLMSEKFSFLSPRSVLLFFLLFGWSGVLLLHRDMGIWQLIGITAFCGILAMLVNAFLESQAMKIKNTAKPNLKDALFRTGKVSSSIPAYKNGFGKVSVQLRTGAQAVDAITDGDALPVGSIVKITQIIDENLLLVEAADGFSHN